MLILLSLDAIETAYMTQFAVNWALLTASLLIAAPVIFFKIKDTTSVTEDLKFSDATFEDVAPDAALEEKAAAAGNGSAGDVDVSPEVEKK